MIFLFVIVLVFVLIIMISFRRKKLITGFIGLVIFILIMILIYKSEFFIIDRCLDSGGRWDENIKKCLYK